MTKCEGAGVVAIAVLVAVQVSWVVAQPLTIYEIQSNTTDGDASSYDYSVVDCAGGVVVGKYAGYRPRLILQDLSHMSGWSSIQVKDWVYNSAAAEWELFDNVSIGDWISLTNVLVEEFRGTTLLEYQRPDTPGFNIISQDNPVPPPIIVAARELPAPVYDYERDGWFVENHDAESYESMRLVIRNVNITGKNLGKAVDNYSIQTPNGEDSWATDYMNEDRLPSGYHPFVAVGQHLCAVSGLFEQYTNEVDGWDYYQLITMKTVDLAICGDGNSDGHVDAHDLPRLGECLMGPLCDDDGGGECDPPGWTLPPLEVPLQHCLMMDLDYDGDVDLRDVAGFQMLFAPQDLQP